MRSIRITTGAVLTVALAIVLLVVDARVESILTSDAAVPDPTASIRDLRVFLLATFVVLALAVWAACAWGWRSIDRTHQRIAGLARRVGEGDLTARLGEARQGPLGSLTGSVNDAIEHLDGILADTRARGRYYAGILDQMTDAVVAVDERNRVRFVNRPFVRLFDVEPGDAAGRPLESVILNYELSALVSRALRQGAVQRESLRLTHPAQHLLECVATPLTSETGAIVGAVALLHDITRLRDADRVREDFVANAGHELRTPAAGIKALAEALQAGALSDPTLGPSFCGQIVDAADRLTEILDDMLTLTRVERGEQLLERRMVDVTSVLENVARQLSPTANQKDLSVNTQCGDEDEVYADPAMLQTLLLNLLENGVKYTPAGGAVTARGRVVPGGYELAVTDTGIGIPREHQERIFERFYRVDRARDRATGSTGLGLSIVRHIAEAHGGHVSVSSQEGEGSTFTAFFPDP